MWLQIIGGASLWVAIYGTFVLNFCDFTRNATSKRAIVKGNFWGIPLNMLVFGAIVITLAGAQFRIDGRIIEAPADIVQEVPNTLLLVLAALALLILTVAVNLMANFVAPIYALNNLFPKQLNFRRAAFISAVIGLVILPWNLYNSPAVINYFLGGLGAILGPLFGIIMADYWLVRRSNINVPALFTTDARGEYHYANGVNGRAVVALVITAVAALLMAFVPAFKVVSEFSWFIGAGLGAIVYLVVADRRGPFNDVSGEPIAVASTH